MGEAGRTSDLAWTPLPVHAPALPFAIVAANVVEGCPPGDPVFGGAPAPSQGSRQGNFVMPRKKEKMEMPICTRVSVSTFRTLEVWCDNSFRKRSEVIGLVLERIVEMVSQQQYIEQPVEEFVRHLHVGPKG
ncbi:MAG: hypothetical protein ACRD3D_09105 [Terriglobia bacterium]